MAYKNTLLLTVDEIREISHFAHWIPITRGYHHEFLEVHYPGWNWNDFLPVLDDAGVIRNHKDGHECIRLRQGICMTTGITSVELGRNRGQVRVIRIALEGEGQR